jgi:hypothetical protein
MKKRSGSRNKKSRKILKWILGISLFFILAAGGLFVYAYFQYGKLIRTFLIETITRESKGLYKAEIGSLYVNIIDGNLTVNDLKLTPDTVLYRQRSKLDTLSPMMFQLKIDHFKIIHFGILKAIRERRIDVDAIRFKAPGITILRMHPLKKTSGKKMSPKLMSIPLPKGWNSICIREILFENGTIDFYDFSGDSIFHQSIPSCFIKIRNILVDPAHPGKQNLFSSDDILIKIKNISFKTKNGLNVIKLGEIGLSTGLNSFYINGFHLIPQLSRHDYTRKLGFQTDRMDIFVGHLNVHRLQFRDLILGGKFNAGLVEIDSMVLDDYRDKRIARRPGFRPPMPQDGIRKLKTYLKIDTVLLHRSKATYAEQVGEEPGVIFFDRMEATVTGLTNDSTLLQAGLVSELRGTAWLMGKGKLDATFRFKFGDTRNSFTFSAHLGSIDLMEINPMLSKLMPARVKSGKIRQLVIPYVSANDDAASGKLLFYYNDLSIEMIAKEKSTWNSIKKGVINFVANDLVVNNNNPMKTGKMKTGVIFFRRDKEKGIINFLWKSALSGLKSTMGFNSKEQKEIRKAEKKGKN